MVEHSLVDLFNFVSKLFTKQARIRPSKLLPPLDVLPGLHSHIKNRETLVNRLHTMLIFTSPDITKGSFELAIARKSPGTYLLILARAYGMAATRVHAVLNVSTPRSTAADKEVLRPTGRVQRMHAEEGGDRDAHQVELVLTEDQLARCCWYCDALEVDTDVRDHSRFPLCSGQGYASTYMCHNCAEKSSFARAVSGFRRMFS
ncbi:hypothetical protein B0H13DRAFT_2001363 [Mycena leptocephala]|nr:hypothetical protein B0H13DRAFT_2001363 [Mycena leptocephala]